ncbi:MAG: polymerase, sigma 70 subunit, RpoD family [Ilumatobacteraceae bacterium]|nr:polymerase, sigma 70 subunit, RpoD family [Ilumatobacteraceae bacterium]
MAIESSIDGRDAVLRDRLRSLRDLPLLSDGEELVAAATMADGRQAENDLAALASQPNVDLVVAAALMERVKRGEGARELLVGSTRRLVVSLARRHPSTAEVTLALLDAGDDAVGRAADRYDPTGGLPFSSFARWWVERAMREVDRHPSQGIAAAPTPADPVLLTALGHLHREDTRVIELRLGLHGGPALSDEDTARVLGIDTVEEHEREEVAVAKLRHPCTPGDLTHLHRL